MASNGLSPQMRVTLRAIVNRPGNFPAFYPGGIRTVGALRRRGLVRFDDVEIMGATWPACYPTAPGFRAGMET